MRTVSDYFRGIFPGKVQKIAVNAGLGCPNRDGTIGHGGCIYCNNSSFNPSYAAGSVSQQLSAGREFFSAKVKDGLHGYLAYFQSFSNTYGPTDRLIALYEEALADPQVVGLVIATRPDCIAPELVDYFASRFTSRHSWEKEAREGSGDKPFLLVELGIESTLDSTLERINRGHDYAAACRAVNMLAGRGIAVGAHLILGLPGESREDMLGHAVRLGQLPVSTLKLHQLQVVRGTALARQWESDPSSLQLFSAEEYAALLHEFVPLLRPDIALDRLVSECPASLLLAPSWGMKPDVFLHRYCGDL